ncbi:MAG: hypothetical protein A2857_03350 [Candidatus Levybacteria bacterium RIFCSPHIGHO2_01_FULL_36_15]|nr:MAG: hypothetical protein A2857_03350 [Candidatus Levybacteria bacterium RIFCSPHIGHO2_01_FULL_36_15]OGH38644.1 MAG: hypothetical protein A2905_06190 [Candidatus Levybacteria bacterium RIFCSPLOWO2_01_FULL_36_10]
MLQEPKNYEVIVVDDGSIDGTKEHLGSLNLPIRIISVDHSGISKVRNIGIKNAMGQYVAFLDSDDLWLPGILKEQLDYLKSHPGIPLAYTDQYIEVDGNKLEKTRFQATNMSDERKRRFNLPGFVQLTPIHISSVMVKKSIFDQMGYFNEDLKIHEDTEMWNRVSEKYELGFINIPLTIFRWEKDKEHILKPELRGLFIAEGRKYMKIYEERREQKGLTGEEKRAIEESYRRIDELEKLVGLRRSEAITEEEFHEKREELFK